MTATEATPDGGKVSVTATASGRRTLVVRAVVRVTGSGAVTRPARGRACAYDADRAEAGFRDAVGKGQADARRRAQAKLDRSEPAEQAELDQSTRDDARDKARREAREQANAT